MARNRVLGSPFEIATTSLSITTEPHIDMYAIQAVLGTPVTVTLDPNAFNGDQVVVQDVGDNAGTQPIVIDASAGQTILGVGASISITTRGGGVLFTFNRELSGWVPQLVTITAASTSPLTEDLDAANFNIKNVKTLCYDQVVDNGHSGTTPDIDWANGGRQKITLTAATVTPTFTAPVGVSNLQLLVTQDAMGGRLVTWPASVKWTGSTPPTLTATPGATDIVSFLFDGTVYWAVLSPNFG